MDGQGVLCLDRERRMGRDDALTGLLTGCVNKSGKETDR